MCGIVGVISTSVLTAQQSEQFKRLLIMDQVRGLDSCGVISEKVSSLDFHKSVWDPATFLADRRTNAVITGAKALVGHNRAATRGNVIASNAHPFHHGPITLVHNGTLAYPMPDHATKFDVDSESIAYNLSLIPPEQAGAFLETVNGAYALVWYDERDSSWNLARNEERPLHYMTVVGGSTMYVSSEAGILYGAVAREVTIADPSTMIVQLPVGEHWKIFTTGSSKLIRTATTFTPKKNVATVQYGRSVAVTTKNTGGTSNGGNAFQDDLRDLLGLTAGWHGVDIDRKSATGGWIGYLREEPFCEVRIHTAEKVDITKDYDVYISGLSKLHPENVKAKSIYDYVLFSSSVREKKRDPIVVEGTKEKVEVEPFQCVNCGGVFLETELYHLNDGDVLCKGCFDADDNDSQLYARTVGIKTLPVK